MVGSSTQGRSSSSRAAGPLLDLLTHRPVICPCRVVTREDADPNSTALLAAAAVMADAGASAAASSAAEVAALREMLAQKEAMLEVAALKRQLAEREEALALQQQQQQPDDPEDEYVPTVPELLELLRSPYHEQRDEAIALLAELVTSAFGEDGEVLGQAIRDGGGVPQLAWLLADPSASVSIQQQSLLVLGNLCSNSVDPNSALTKRMLLQVGQCCR